MTESVFILIILLGIGIPIASFAILLLLGFFEKEFDYLEEKNRRVEIEKELHRMEYLQLSQQIQPHFMFNSLNAMLSLSRLGRTENVTHALEEFSQFLRYKYQQKDLLVPFEREKNFTSHYIAVQSIRFGGKLQIEWTIDAAAKSTYLPPYLLQTLVENAFKHGLEKKMGEKTLHIMLFREGNWVTLLVRDNGPRWMKEEVNEFGIGLQNIQKRLSLLFDLYTEVLLERIAEETIAKVVWPYTPEGKI
ncbi:sensor histidine kinase [Niallia sp. NCCP-28]|uniref:sensor histidine kinase n=1 Tax=Niallia sp. NCCP-28 TaxID=2934712 RepID=UPI002085C471|nr:histidine kinase [Niallia sp. NCCP-28]GKU81946.1 sensor histidine kinase [Niallia sp. NCCP-28]